MESTWKASGWLPLDYANAVHAPDTYGAVLVANAKQEPLLVTHGVIRQEVWRILDDPLARANGVASFRYVETLFDTKAEKLAHEMYERWGTIKGRPVRWRYFAVPDTPAAASPDSAKTLPSDSETR